MYVKNNWKYFIIFCSKNRLSFIIQYLILNKYSEKIQFGILSISDISRMACVELVNRGLYNENKESIPFGPLDNKLVNINISNLSNIINYIDFKSKFIIFMIGS